MGRPVVTSSMHLSTTWLGQIDSTTTGLRGHDGTKTHRAARVPSPPPPLMLRLLQERSPAQLAALLRARRCLGYGSYYLPWKCCMVRLRQASSGKAQRRCWYVVRKLYGVHTWLLGAETHPTRGREPGLALMLLPSCASHTRRVLSSSLPPSQVVRGHGCRGHAHHEEHGGPVVARHPRQHKLP